MIYTKEDCKEVAKKCTSKKALKKSYPEVFKVCEENGWTQEFEDSLVFSRVPFRYWNEEHIREEAKKYETIPKFRDNSQGAYHAAVKLGILDDLGLERSKWTPRGFWTYETCMEESKKYKNRYHFNLYSPGAYRVASKNKWLDLYTWLLSSDQLRDHCVYIYIFDDLAFYVGLTCNKENRINAHNTESKSAVFKHSKEAGLSIPEPIYLEDNLTALEAQEKEGYYIDLYSSKEGYTKLNSAKAGKGVGSLGNFRVKWTYNTCLEVAKKYKTLRDFQSNGGGAFDKAWAKGWLKDYTWLEKQTDPKFTFEYCMEQSKLYLTLSEFKDNEPVCYDKSNRNGWIKKFIWLA